jgi:hypothetical protein
VIPFVRRADGVHLRLASGERAVLTSLVEQLRQVLDHGLATDPVAARMFPDAYPEDDEASGEFRRFTQEDLRVAKSANAAVVHEWLTGTRQGALTRFDEQAWLRSLTDLRLTIADRLGIVDRATADNGLDEDDNDDGRVGLRDVYDWLGYVQEHLVVTISSR